MMRKIRLRLSAGMMGLALGTLATTPASAETLADAIAAAYRTNPQLLGQRADARATDETLVQARAAYGPVLTVQASREYTYEKAHAGNASTEEASNWNTTITGSAQQTLFSSGRSSGAVRIARANIDAARERLRLVESNVLLAVVRAYVAVRRDQQLLAIAKENVDLLAGQRADTAARLKAREATATDYAQTDVRFNFALARVKEAVAALETSKAQYLLAVGMLPGDLAPEPALPGVPMTLDEAYGAADRNNPQFLAAVAREQASRAAIGATRAAFGPSVALQASGGRGPLSSFSTARRDFVSGGVVATVPIYDSGLTASRVREAQARNDQDMQAADQTRREVHQAVAQSWEQMAAFRGTIRDYRTAVGSAREAFSGAREQERAGVRTTLDVLDQARDLLDARTGLTQAQANEYIARTTLLATMGRLEAPLLAPVTAYDPRAHLRRVGNVLVPPYHPLLQAVDSIANTPIRPRPSRDPAATIVKPAGTRLPIEPDTSR